MGCGCIWPIRCNGFDYQTKKTPRHVPRRFCLLRSLNPCLLWMCWWFATIAGSARQTGYFLCVAKESNQRKATPRLQKPRKITAWPGAPRTSDSLASNRVGQAGVLKPGQTIIFRRHRGDKGPWFAMATSYHESVGWVRSATHRPGPLTWDLGGLFASLLNPPYESLTTKTPRHPRGVFCFP
jgi:hypothetical protein